MTSDPLSEKLTAAVCDCGGTMVQTDAPDGQPQHGVGCPARPPADSERLYLALLEIREIVTNPGGLPASAVETINRIVWQAIA